MKRMTVFASAAIAAVSLFAMPAAAQQPDYPPDGETVTVSDATPAPGQAVTITATGFLPGETVTFTVDGTLIGSDVADATGTASITFNAPTTPGTYVISATGGTSGGSATTIITVVAAAGGDGAQGGLPFTGSDIGNLVVPGAVAIGVGALLVAVASSRRRHSATPAS